MLTRRIASSLLMVFAVALAASRAQAQIGCWADDNSDGTFVCEPRQARCVTDESCLGPGELCNAGFCPLTPRTPCTPCLLRVGTCPLTFDDIPGVGPIGGAGCGFRYPCGAVLEVTAEGPAVSNSLCFLGPDRATAVPWNDGDCDGDGVTNLLEESSFVPTEECVTVVTPSGPPSTGSHLIVVGGRGTGAPGLDVAPVRVLPATWVGLLCSADQHCPAGAPDEPTQGRCAYLNATDGVCLYSDLDPTLAQLPHDDRSCAAPIVMARPLPMGRTSRRDLQETDYDMDGLLNADDPQVCASLQVVDFSGGMLHVAPSALLDGCGGVAEARVVLPEGRCANPVAPNAFGVACTTRNDCPVVESAGVRAEVRCVQFPGSGVCVYGGGMMADPSCLGASTFGACGFGTDGYSAFAVGNCDGDADHNVSDPEMCTPPVVLSDTGRSVDAGPVRDADAFTDADALADAAARGDAFVPTDTFGGGGGCTCGVGGQKPGFGSALLALGLAGAFWLRRRGRHGNR